MAATKIEGRESTNYSFTHEGKELKYEIQEPTFDEIVASLSQIGNGDSAGLIGCGKVIWELCCISFDKEIEKKASVLISVCLKLATEYSLPTDIEIKKK
jgi:hypothetical protein